MTKIRIGIIGYGSWVKRAYLPSLEHDVRAEIVAISAKSETTLKLIKEDFGDGIEVHNGYESLLSSPNIDAVMLAVPDSVHASALSATLASGKAVFYEPPIAHTRSLIPTMIKKLLAAPQITHADLELALVPAVTKAAKLIKKQFIGRVQTASIRLQSSWGADPNQDVNNIARLSVWYTHVLNVLLDASPKRVLIMDGYGTAGRRQSQSTGFFDYNGIWGELKVNIDSGEKLTINIEVVGDSGDLQIDLLTGEMKKRNKSNPAWKIELLPAIQPYASWPGMHESVASFLDSVEKGTPSFANAAVVAKLNLIALASEESKETGTWAMVKGIDSLLTVRL